MARTRSALLFSALVSLGVLGRVSAQVGTVLHQQKISEVEGGFHGPLDPNGRFGRDIEALGDLGGDGTIELAVVDLQHTLWILSLGPDGRVVNERAITTGAQGRHDLAVARVGDMDGDGITELAVGFFTFVQHRESFVEIFFLDSAGGVKRSRVIAPSDPVFVPAITSGDAWGFAIAGIGDVDGDGIADIAVGAPEDDDGPGLDNGAVWIVHLRNDGSPKSAFKINELRGGGAGLIDANGFGYSIAPLGDLDGDGNRDLLVGCAGSTFIDPSLQPFGILVLFLDASARVLRVSSILQEEFARYRDASGNEQNCGFGLSVATLGDLDADGTVEIAVGAPTCEGGEFFVGSLKRDGTLARKVRIKAGVGGFSGILSPGVSFGCSLASLGDIDGDGAPELAVGSFWEDDGGSGPGAVWILGLDQSPVRNSGSNPLTLSETGQPALGRPWTLTLDCTAHGAGLAFVAGYERPHPGSASPAGVVLVDLTSRRLFRFSTAHIGAAVNFTPVIPSVAALLGMQLHVQGLVTGAPASRLSNALDVVIGK